jgi:hypothetical protein
MAGGAHDKSSTANAEVHQRYTLSPCLWNEAVVHIPINYKRNRAIRQFIPYVLECKSRQIDALAPIPLPIYL